MTTPPDRPVIAIDSAVKAYRLSRRQAVPALHGVSLEVHRGEFVFIVGPSGSGKSTLLKLLTCEERPDAGSVVIDGVDVSALPRRKLSQLRRRVGVIYQDFKLLPDKTVAENVAFALEVHGLTGRVIATRVPQVLELVGLADKADVLPRQLSGGQQQRVSVARALVGNPALLLCDEPTGNLDPRTTVDLVALLAKINRRGTTVVMITHDHLIVDEMRRRVIELAEGHVVRDSVGGFFTPAPPLPPALTAGLPADPELEPAGRAPLWHPRPAAS